MRRARRPGEAIRRGRRRGPARWRGPRPAPPWDRSRAASALVNSRTASVRKLVREAGAVVGDRHPHVTVVPTDRDVDERAAGRVSNGVVEQIPYHPAQFDRASPHLGRSPTAGARRRTRLRSATGCMASIASSTSSATSTASIRHFESAGLDSREQEQVFHEAGEGVDVGAERTQVASRVGGYAILERLDRYPHGGEGRAQVVAQRGEQGLPGRLGALTGGVASARRPVMSSKVASQVAELVAAVRGRPGRSGLLPLPRGRWPAAVSRSRLHVFAMEVDSTIPRPTAISTAMRMTRRSCGREKHEEGGGQDNDDHEGDGGQAHEKQLGPIVGSRAVRRPRGGRPTTARRAAPPKMSMKATRSPGGRGHDGLGRDQGADGDSEGSEGGFHGSNR